MILRLSSEQGETAGFAGLPGQAIYRKGYIH
jgi:hypothetical protein